MKELKHGNTEQYDLNDFEEEKLIFVKLQVPLRDSLQNIKTIFNCLLCAYVYFMKNRKECMFTIRSENIRMHHPIFKSYVFRNI